MENCIFCLESLCFLPKSNSLVSYLWGNLCYEFDISFLAHLYVHLLYMSIIHLWYCLYLHKSLMYYIIETSSTVLWLHVLLQNQTA